MMKNRQLHTIILPLCTLLLFSCTQDNISPASDTENEIRFQTGTTTRGLIDNLAVGSEICLYGYHGDKFLAENNTDKKLAGKTLKYLNTGRWSVVNGDNPITYFWEGTDTYRFFGWLQKDANGLTAAGLTTNYAENKLTVSGTLNDQYNQFDFMYSDVDQRTLTDENMANEKGRPVAMNMNHLFSAFSIGIQNTSEDDITVNSIKLQRLHTTGTATIDFSSATKVAYNTYNTSSTEQPLAENKTVYTLQGTKSIAGGTSKPNIFDPADTKQRYYMVWPQAVDVIYSSELKNKPDDEVSTMGDEHFPLIMDYTVNGESVHKKMKFPEMAWEPGKKYSFDVLIADKIVELQVNVTDWNYASSEVDFREQAIEIDGDNHLEWDETKSEVDHTKKEVYITNGLPAEATFAFAAPEGGKWSVSFADDGGDVTKFRIIDDSDNAYDGLGAIDGKLHRIKIEPLFSNEQESFKVRLKFTVITADNKTYPADDMVQIVGKEVNGETIHETAIYTIVQKAAN